MRIGEISISGYRSLRAIRFPVGGLTVFVGANGVGKTNLHRALELLQAAASLHPELLEPFARMVVRAAERSAPRSGSSPIPSGWRIRSRIAAR
jgi:predicted ATPase